MKNTSRTHSRTKNSLTYPLSERLLVLPNIISLITFKFLAILTVFSIISFLVFYIFQITTTISEGYQIQSYQKKISNLSQENKNLEVSVAMANSLEDINNKMQELGFEKMTKVYYIQLLETSVAQTQNKVE